MKKRHPFSVAPEKGFIIVLVAMHRGMLLNSLWELEHLTFVEVLERLANRAEYSIARGKAFT